MPKPTQGQLDKINKLAIEPLTEDEVYVFPNLMIDDQPTSYSSKIHDNLLRKFMKDAKRGVGLLMNHNNKTLPVGRSFDAELREEVDETTGQFYKTVYGQFYIDLGRQTQSGMSTDDLVKGINAGTIFDTSIGFNSEKWDCSICNYDIRDWNNCSHMPGEKYQVENENGTHVETTCYVIAGADGAGELLENSLVYAGAVDRATIVQNFSAGDVRESDKGSNLHLVESFKNIPTNATIYQYFTKDGVQFYTNSSERTNGLEELKKRSEQEVEFAKFKETVETFGIKFETPEELSAEISKLTEAQTELATKVTEAAELSTKVEDLTGQLSEKEATIADLTATNEALAEKAELANTYRQDLTEKALEVGVRAQGNAFQKGMHEKFLATLSIDEIKEVISGFETEVKERFANARTTEVPDAEPTRLSKDAEPQNADEFEDETEFRNKVADEAIQYSKEHGVSFKEASKLIYEKYTVGGAE
ncbi:DUF3435 domain-containing protein [Peribacillus frigoritolerans]|uniref:Uncharacterized protein n=1 Tax=Peribacillus castrilensis TaxID=2897690 RepID=A0AAW9NJH2_9BACI|nr:hypothetical protein [Peribacillus castrilensis]